MQYIRTKDMIIDLDKVKSGAIDDEMYYTDFIFEDPKQVGDNIEIHYTAVGKETNSIEDQRGRRCNFCLVRDGDYIIKESDNLEELVDGFIYKDTDTNQLYFYKDDAISLIGAAAFTETLRGYIETEVGLVYVYKMNSEGKLELI